MSTEFDDAISNLVQAHWERSARPVLLSSLGALLSQEHNIGEQTLGVPLSRYIATNLGAKVRLIQDPQDPKILGAVPAGADYEPLSPLVEGKKQKPLLFPRVRYHPELWRAFSSHLAPGNRRYVRLQPVIEYRDVQDGMQGYEHETEILPDYVVDTLGMDGGQRFNAISSRIEDWAAINNLDISHAKGLESIHHGHTPRTVLDAVISSIPSELLSEIKLPLNLIKMLRDHQLK